MRLASDFLDQAEHLARKERLKPKQASLRRSISTAYYALFHFLVEAAVREVPQPFRKELKRAFDHAAMKKVAQGFAAGQPFWPPPLRTALPVSIPDDLKKLAEVFTDLQLARHNADYDLGRTFTRSRALAAVHAARNAISAWNRLRNSDMESARVFLFCLLFGAASRR